MDFYYQGTDMKDYATVTQCVHRDVSHGRADALEMTVSHAARWYRWGPQTDDEIIVTRDGYTTGKLYLNTITPEGDHFRVIATSLPSGAVRKGWATYENMTFGTILHRAATECGMGAALYGVEGNMRYPFLARQNEGNAAFLDRLAAWEGIALKAVNGSFRGIGIGYAQRRKAVKRLTVRAEDDNAVYTRMGCAKYDSLTVETPWASAAARDSAAPRKNPLVLCHLPARDRATAGRWARGLLLKMNRKAERLTIQSRFDPSMTAMIRVDIAGDTDANGAWLVDEVEHDIYNGRSVTRLLRVVETIA